MKRTRLTALPARAGLATVALLTLAACGADADEPAARDAGGVTSSPTSSAAPGATAGTPATPAEQPTDAAPAASEPTTSAPASTSRPELVSYAGGESAGVQVADRKQAARLQGAPADFKAFIGRTAQRLHDQTTCTTAAVGITVEAVRSDGYAVGGVNECGGYAALWATTDGAWKEIAGTQDTWDCAVLEQYQVPSDIAGDSCYSADDNAVQKYEQT